MPSAQSTRPRLSQAFVDAHKREVLAEAVAAGAHCDGLRAQTAAVLARRTRISRGRFYELFGSRGACVEFACRGATEALTKALGAVTGVRGSQQERAESAVDALIAAVMAEPLTAELCLVHSPTADLPEPHRFRRAVVDATWQALGGDRTAELAANAIVTMVTMQLARDAVAGLPQLRDGLVGLSGA